MKLDEFKSILDDPTLIPGIYNYCDRWCERCSMTTRCSVFLATPKLEPDDFDTEEAFMEEVFKGVHDSFQLTMELIQESADEKGIDLTEIEEDPDWKEKRDNKQSEIKKSPLSSLAWDYADLARTWLKDISPSLKDLEANLQQTALMGLPDRNPEKEAIAIRDAMEVIPWYMHQIYIKLMRAQDGRIEDDAWFEENDFPKDSDGSARVALIGIDNSIKAWSTMMTHLTQQEDVILPILSKLEHLRGLVEREFPGARSFKRPGFDVDAK